MASGNLDPRIKVRHLVCFVEVCRSRSVAAAAETLNMSQPAATKTIRELEGVLGEALFDRSRRKLALTVTGRLFLHYATTSLAALRSGVAAVRNFRDEPLIRVGALPTVSAQVLPKAVRRFNERGLDTRIRVVTGPNAYLLSLLRTGDVDIVIGRMADPEAITGLAFEHLYSEDVVFAVRPGHPLLSEARFALPMIERFQILVPPPDAVIRTSVDRFLVAGSVGALRHEIETVSNAFGRSYTRMSDAVWIISRGVVADDIADGLLAILPVRTDETLGPVGLTTRTDTTLSSGVELLAEIVREVVEAERGQAPGP